MDTFLINLVNSWPNTKDEFIVVCNRGHPGYHTLFNKIRRPNKVYIHGIRTYSEFVLYCRKSKIANCLRKIFSPLIRLLFFGLFFFRIREIFRIENPDQFLVVNGGHPGGDTCRAAVISWSIFEGNKSRPVYNFHGFAQKLHWHNYPIEWALDFLIIQFSSVIVGVSKACLESIYARNRLFSFNKQKIVWIYNGISENDSYFSGINIRDDLNIPAGSPICLVLATYQPQKGHLFLLNVFSEVLKKFPEAYLVCCGDGYEGEKEIIQSAIKRLGLEESVRISGFRKNVNEIIRDSTILLVGSQEPEAFGLTVLESMANSIPVVATDVGGIPEVLKSGEGGYCISHTNVQKFSAAIIDLLGDEISRLNQGRMGYKRFKNLFGVNKMTSQYNKLFGRTWR
jgi:glycosyltransferase involved in cell wall biosynthesis